MNNTLNEYRIMFLKHYFHRSALGYSLTLAQAHAGREIASLSYSLALAHALASHEIASLSSPKGLPAERSKGRGSRSQIKTEFGFNKTCV